MQASRRTASAKQTSTWMGCGRRDATGLGDGACWLAHALYVDPNQSFRTQSGRSNYRISYEMEPNTSTAGVLWHGARFERRVLSDLVR